MINKEFKQLQICNKKLWQYTSLGVVVSGFSRVGSNLTLTGGNIIGARPLCKPGQIEIGHDCNMGANAVIIGNHVQIGASACVVSSFKEDNSILVGVPAKRIE